MARTVVVEIASGAVAHVTVPAGVRVVVIDRDDPDAERTIWTDDGGMHRGRKVGNPK